MPATPQSVSPVYMSGPMFSHADKQQQKALAEYLEQPAVGMKCYLPQHDGIEVGKLMKHANDPESGINLIDLYAAVQFVREIVYTMDMYQLLSRCNSLVFNMDGRVPDEGSVSETAAAWTSGQPIVIWKTTPITILGGFDNPMVDGLSSNWQMISKLADLPKAITDAADHMQANNPTRFTPGWQVAAVVKLGSFVWTNMPTIKGILDADPPPPPAVMIKELLALAVQWQDGLKAAYPYGPPVWMAPPPG